MVTKERLEAVYQAGLRRDYDFNNREYYETDEEALAFNNGLRDSMKEKPVQKTGFRFFTVEYFDFHDLQERRSELAKAGNPKLSQCTHCQTIFNDVSGPCPGCGQNYVVPFDDNRIDQEYPWSSCEHCRHDFLWDDALGSGGEQGSYICPACGKTT